MEDPIPSVEAKKELLVKKNINQRARRGGNGQGGLAGELEYIFRPVLLVDISKRMYMRLKFLS